MKFYKKGGAKEAVKPVIQILLGILIVLGSLYYLVALGSLLIPKEIDPVTDSNFKSLTNQVQTMLDNPEKVVVERNFPFQIEDNYVLVGFNKDKGNVETNCVSTEIGAPIYKPLEKCGDSACLCIFLKGEENPVEKALDCELYPSVDNFYSYQNSVINRASSQWKRNFRGGQLKYNQLYQNDILYLSNLVVFGNCQFELKNTDAPNILSLGIINLYIEKLTADGNNLLITYDATSVRKSAVFDERFEELKKRIQK